ncbi:DUF3732 domain-containing protein [Bacillus toyonensis]
MNCYIKAILLFNNEGKKRIIPLSEGLNIITGESKSGKSALLEIIDYCFGSSSSTIPKGIITDFTYLYSLVLQIETTTILLGRKSIQHNGRNNMFITTINGDIDPHTLELSNYNEHYFIQRGRAIRELENFLGMNISDISEDVDRKKEGKPSIRHMMSFLLQHQNLVASKFALFYRFDDSRKKEQVINQFPVFAGWVDQNYYSLKYKLDLFRKKLKQQEKEVKSSEIYLQKKEKQLLHTYNEYLSLVGEKPINTVTLKELMALRSSSPSFSETSYLSSNIQTNYTQLKNELENLRKEKHKVELIISNLETSEHYGKEYIQNLAKLNSKANASKPKHHEYFCPICGNIDISLNNELTDVLSSIHWLEREIADVRYHKNSYHEKIVQYKNEILNLDKEIKNKITELDNLQRINQEIFIGKSLNDQVIYAKAKLDLEIEMLSNTIKYFNDEELNMYQDQITELEKQISGYGIDAYYNEAKQKISTEMNRIINELDFEEEFKPPNIIFELDNTFDLYHLDRKNRNRIYLSEMGSGANWLSCHLGLFLSLLRYYCGQKNSPIPKFLFFDQPSQVYFPDTSVKSMSNKKDILAVENIYKVVLEEIEGIKKECGFRPQVIITDHVTGLDLGEYNFKDYLRAWWFGDKLI